MRLRERLDIKPERLGELDPPRSPLPWTCDHQLSHRCARLDGIGRMYEREPIRGSFVIWNQGQKMAIPTTSSSR
jgi:hypothetical protein